jgi:hypothetical protein
MRTRMRGDFRADDWFKKVCWATSAAAIHNIIQLKSGEFEKERKKYTQKDLKIGLDDDPLAFLGILVDLLQEWDRYSVKQRGESMFSDDDLLQSIEVFFIAPSFSRILYPNEKAEELIKTMEKCLSMDDVEEIVKIDAYVKDEHGIMRLQTPSIKT